jgi:phospholipase/carboxylesterase
VDAGFHPRPGRLVAVIAVATLDGPRLAPASGAAAKQLVVLLHGYGSSGADLIQLAPQWRTALPDAAFVAPNAPESCPFGGRQWWALTDFSRRGLSAGVGRAAPSLDTFLDAELERTGLDESVTVLVGFSQGTMMALHVGPCRERRLAGIIGYSGMLADPSGLSRRIRTKPPVLLVHGTLDNVVPFTAMKEAETELHRQGLVVTGHVAAGLGHGVDLRGIEAGRAFAERVLAAPSA